MCTDDGNRQERHGARGATMRRKLTRRPTQINGVGPTRDIARESQQSPPQKRTRLPPRRSEGRNEWATPTGPPTEEQTREKVTDPGRGRTKQRGKNSRWLAASGRERSAPAAPGCQENRPAEAEATPEGEGSKPKRQSADRGQSRLGEPGGRPTARGAQRREPRNPPKPTASERYTRKEGTSGCRAQSWATDRGTNRSRQKRG